MSPGALAGAGGGSNVGLGGSCDLRLCFMSEECQPRGLGWEWGHSQDTPHSAGCLACPVRIPRPGGTAMFSPMQQPPPICVSPQTSTSQLGDHCMQAQPRRNPGLKPFWFLFFTTQPPVLSGMRPMVTLSPPASPPREKRHGGDAWKRPSRRTSSQERMLSSQSG